MFSKKPAETPRSSLNKPVASQSSTFSVIGPDVSIKGDIAASADLHVDGAVQGDITCASLVQGEGSVIEGAIEAQTARLAGTVKGTIAARELVILKSAHIEGDVRYDALTIEQGASVEGRFAHDAAKANSGARESDASDKPSAGEKGSDGEPRLTLAG